ncbi:MAG: DUF3300 domain-containing protein [Rhodanobacteraceae bacterium]
MKIIEGFRRAGATLAFALWATCACAQGAGGAPAAATAPAPAQDAAQPSQKLYTSQQLDQMLAPVALYPDSLLSQLLMATTYPGDFAEAAEWVRSHEGAKGDEAVKQVEGESWDPSVKSLVAVPQVLAQFGPQVDWVQKLGDAFLAQPDDVMASVQRLRAQAQKAGTLKTTEQQKVVVQAPPEAPSTTVIQIEPADPQIVYVPTYNPAVVYGAWAYPSYPPYYYPPPPYYYHPVASGLAAGIAFGVGVAAVNSLWGGFNWGRHDVNININRYNNVNINNRISGNGNVNWNHNAANRRGTPYADNRSRQNYGQGVSGANGRQNYRGNDGARDRAQQSFDRTTGFEGSRGNASNRASAGQMGANRGNAGANRGEGGANRANAGGGNREFGSSNRGGANAAANRSSGSRSSAFSGASSNRGSQREMSRGQSSQRSMASSGGRGAGAGRQVSRPSPRAGGGGGGRRR